MCEACDGPISRRRFVGTSLTGAAMTLLGATAVAGATATAGDATQARAVRLPNGLDVLPRSAWGADLPPKGPMGTEDVRFLLVHQTESPNSITDPRRVIRSAYFFHTGSAKGWNDVAYNFFVGPDGSVWEGRAGSLDRPVTADATGGNQGFAQLVCLVGDYRAATPSAAMQHSLVLLLAYLSTRYGLSTWKGASNSIVSRGSNKWPTGSVIDARTISGHRDMSYTDCPGDVAYGLLDDWRSRVHHHVAASWTRSGLQPAVRTRLQAP